MSSVMTEIGKDRQEEQQGVIECCNRDKLREAVG